MLGFSCPSLLESSCLSALPVSISMRSIDMGVAYAIFTGIGTLGSTLLGMWRWGESRRPLRLAFVGMIIVAVAGLKLSA
ncbi:DMT family transporter [Salinicola peritrichatus]|uniref:DMT family transporter n=1 Tax=Salinicola peritrichatus TaxID=1267424 RepID=UPI000DA26697|nr:SMR family transporter [Salinicola peritrichatus]